MKPRIGGIFGDADCNSSTFRDNMSLPIHRWFRYSAENPAEWVERCLKAKGRDVQVLDPFAGSGTTLIAAASQGAKAIGVESHPFVARIALAKASAFDLADAFRDFAGRMVAAASSTASSLDHYPSIIRRCYPDDVPTDLDRLRSAWASMRGEPASSIAWLALTSILRECSPVGTASWQYVLPKKSKKNPSKPSEAFKRKASQIVDDLSGFQQVHDRPLMIEGDARRMVYVEDGWANLVITSPPYPNNFDYADATRLEMAFWGEAESWSALNGNVRSRRVRSCTQQVSSIAKTASEIIADPSLGVIASELGDV